jgi:KTSC domain
MERKPVKSSNIAEIGHSGTTLEVKFKNGGVFRYHNVDADKHAALMRAESVGKHFHAHIKNAHKFSKADPE